MYSNLKYTQKLEAAGFSRDQAEATVTLVVDAMDEHFATKKDFDALRSDMKIEVLSLRHEMKELAMTLRHEMKEMETGIRHDMKEMETGIRHDMKEMESRMTLKLGGIMVAGVTVMLTVLPYLIK